MKKAKQKEPFVGSGIRQQGFFMPQLFPSMNEYSRLCAQTWGTKGHRGTSANTLKAKMETTVRLHIRLNKLVPMDSAFFFLNYYENSRLRNKDNIAALAKKFLFDALQDQGILKNDGWKEIMGWHENFFVTPGTPGLHVEMFDPLQSEMKIGFNVQTALEQTFKDWKRLMKEISR